jgi:MFS family permease
VNKRLMVAVLVGSFGGFVFGFDLGALSAATESLRTEFALSPWAFGVTVSASIWGTVAGAILAGRFADRVVSLHTIPR